MAKTKRKLIKGMFEITIQNPENAGKIGLDDFISIEGVPRLLQITHIVQDQKHERYLAKPIEIQRLGDDFEVKILGPPEKYGFIYKKLNTKKTCL